MNKRLIHTAAISAAAILAGCPSSDFPSCSSALSSHPEGKCSAYYYKTDYGSGGKTTQAMTDCSIGSKRLGGNIVAFHTLQHGIGLRWLGPNTLEIAVPDGVKLENQRTSATYSGYPLSFVYRRLQPHETEFIGCTPERKSGGT